MWCCVASLEGVAESGIDGWNGRERGGGESEYISRVYRLGCAIISQTCIGGSWRLTFVMGPNGVAASHNKQITFSFSFFLTVHVLSLN